MVFISQTEHESLIEQARSRYAHFQGLEAPPESLPLLTRLVDANASELDFSDCDVLFVQHLLGPTFARLHAMWDQGLERTRTWFVDIPYSTHEPLRARLFEAGVPPEQVAPRFADPLVPYSTAQKFRVAEILRRLVDARPKARILVVDDGAYVVRVAHLLRQVSPRVFDALVGRTAIVEQTTRGHRALAQRRYRETLEALRAPAVSIARCDTKTGFEGPFIGQAVARKISDLVGRAGRELGHTAVIGFGTVGRETLRRLRCADPAPTSIDVVDTDRGTHADIAAESGRPWTALPSEGRYDTVVGCTGYGSFGWEQRQLLRPDAVLASGSSAAIEFNRELFVDRAARDPGDGVEILDPEATRREGIRAEIRIRDGDRRFSFLHAGFPANFDGELECVPAEVIQATHGLLLMASMQTLREEPGFRPIDPKLDAEVMKGAVACLREALAQESSAAS